MRRSVIVALAAACALTTTPAVAAKKPIRPEVVTPATRTIPWFECYHADEWVRFVNSSRGRSAGYWVTVRKPGYSQPIKGGRICGYMGSGTYNLRIRVNWDRPVKVSVRKPVYRWKTVQKIVGYTMDEPVYEQRTFTCDFLEGDELQYDENGGLGWGMAYYMCRYDNGAPWVDPAGTEPVEGGYDKTKDYSLDRPETYMMFGPDGRTLAINEAGSPGPVLPPVITGKTSVLVSVIPGTPIYEPREKRYVHHYRRMKRTKWVEARPFVVNRSIRVTVN